MQDVLTKVIQLQQHVIAIRASAPTLENFKHHASGDDISTSKILRVGCVTLHKAFAIFIDEVTTFPSASFGH